MIINNLPNSGATRIKAGLLHQLKSTLNDVSNTSIASPEAREILDNAGNALKLCMRYYDEGRYYKAEMTAKEALQLLRRIPHIEKEFSQAWYLLQQALKTLWMAQGTGLTSKRSQELLREASREAKSAYNALKTYDYNISKAHAKNVINLVSLAYDVDRVYQKNPKMLKVDEDLLQETVTSFGFLLGTASTIIGITDLLRSRRRKLVI